jgi:heme-degrading monooxygenase HmoA
MTYNIVWEFRVAPERAADFKAAYGPGGEWARLFGQAAGFLEVVLLRSVEADGRYLTVDRWESRSAFEAFQARFAADYKALDERLEGLATAETRVGAFVNVSAVAGGLPADGTGGSE